MDGNLLIVSDVADDRAQAVREAGLQRDRLYGSTPREIEIVKAIVAGDSNRDIAAGDQDARRFVRHFAP